MDCEHVQNQVLDAFDDAPPEAVRHAIAAHLAGCATCAAFAARQRALDRKLTALLLPPQLDPAFRVGVRARLIRERRLPWRDSVPDIVHFVTCGVATVACVAFVPLDTVKVAAAGVLTSFLSYALLTTVRQSLEDIELCE